MAARLEITLQDHLIDPEGEGIRKKARVYFGIDAERVRSVALHGPVPMDLPMWQELAPNA